MPSWQPIFGLTSNVPPQRPVHTWSNCRSPSRENPQQPLVQPLRHDAEIGIDLAGKPAEHDTRGSPGACRIQSTLKFQSMKVRFPGISAFTRFSPKGAETV